MSVRAEALAVESLIAWLRLKLPAKVTEVNAARAVTLKTPLAGPFTIPASAVLKVSKTTKDGTQTSISLTGGSRTTTQLVSKINTGFGSTIASADADDRLTLTGSAPVEGTPSCIFVGGDSTGANTALGWDAGGESVISTALVTPAHRNIMDGWPMQLDATGGFIVIIGRRSAAPVDRKQGERRDEHIVTLDVSLFRPAIQQENHRSREHISACVQCVREVLKTDAGLQLGRAANGDIVKVEVGQVTVEGMRFQPMKEGKMFGPAFDSAALKLYVLVYERPAAS